MSGSRASGARKGARWGMAKVAFRRNRERIQKDLEVELPLAEIHRQLKEALEGCSYDRFVRLVTAEFGGRNERKRRREQKPANAFSTNPYGAGAPTGGAVETATGGNGGSAVGGTERRFKPLSRRPYEPPPPPVPDDSELDLEKLLYVVKKK